MAWFLILKLEFVKFSKTALGFRVAKESSIKAADNVLNDNE